MRTKWLLASPVSALAERVATLKSDNSPLTAANYAGRVQTIRDWDDELTTRGLFLTQQDLNLTMARQIEPVAAAAQNMRHWMGLCSGWRGGMGKSDLDWGG